MNIAERVAYAEQKTNQSPTEAQKLSGNYKKGKVSIRGFPISIENPIGSIRSGKDKKGDTWTNEVKNTYGYFRGTIGKDNDPIDVYLGNNLWGDIIYVIDQIDPDTGIFDEHKVMFGFDSIEEAQEAYLSNFNKGWKGLGGIYPIRIEVFTKWLYDNKTSRFPFSNFKNKMAAVNLSTEQGRTEHILLEGEVIDGQTLNAHKRQISGDFDVLVIEYISHGGSVTEGMNIMVWLKELIDNGKYIISIVTGNAYSIVSLISQVANERYVGTHSEIMVHNPLMPELTYVNAEELEQYAASLRELEDFMHNLYQNFTGLSIEEIKSLMDNETYISPQRAVELGFADHIVNTIKKPYSKVINKQAIMKNNSLNHMLNLLHKAIALVNGAKVVNQTYNALNGDTIEIYQSSQTGYAVGDSASVKEGTYELADGTVVIEDYKVKEVIPVGLEPAPVEPVEPAPVEPVEPMDVTEPKPEEPLTPAMAEPTEPIKPPESPELELVEAYTSLANKLAECMTKLEEQASKIATLETQLGAVNEVAKKTICGVEDLNKFQELATEAISNIASKTSSTWKPVAKATEVEQVQGSIFQRLKAARGI